MAIKTNLRELVTHEPPPFHKQQLTLWREWSDPLVFIEKDRIVENESIDLSNIIGHGQGYGKMTWEYMLWNLKRIDRRYSELENP